MVLCSNGRPVKAGVDGTLQPNWACWYTAIELDVFPGSLNMTLPLSLLETRIGQWIARQR
jgi:hypothetical protein